MYISKLSHLIIVQLLLLRMNQAVGICSRPTVLKSLNMPHSQECYGMACRSAAGLRLAVSRDL